jgi:murein DD-endopeptidase MepM/ murein hydrolase activator NlpD
MQNRSSLSTARSLTLSSFSQTLTGAVGKRHPETLYSFRISDRSSFNVSLSPLKANADVALMQDRDRNGRLDASEVIKASTHLGTRKDKISTQLDKGNYYLRVSPGSTADKTKYSLDVDSESLGLYRYKYFGDRTLTGKPTATGYAGDGSLNLAIDWKANPPARTAIDNFSARFTTQRNLPPGLYHVQVQASDGIRVKVGKQTVIDQWVDQAATPHSGYFYSDGKSDLPIAIESSNSGDPAPLQVSITQATPFEDAADASQQWKTTLFSWDNSSRDNSQSNAPAIDFAKGGLTNKRAIGGINLGSSVRSDGKPGIAFNWGTGTYVSDGYRLPHDAFVLQSTTTARFDGGEYRFRAAGDDGFQLFAKRQDGSKVYAITPKKKWVESNQTQEFTYTLPAGQYDLSFNYFDRRDTASFDLSWEKVPQSNPQSNPLPNPKPNPKPSSSSLWDSPLHNYPITSPFGQRTYQNGNQQVSGFHAGVDIGTGDEHPAIEAARKGVVISAGMTDGGYGNLVEIDHGNGLETTYAHLDKITVKVGDRVDVDTILGYAGATGNATGNHLHFEVRQNGEAQNPETFLNIV